MALPTRVARAVEGEHYPVSDGDPFDLGSDGSDGARTLVAEDQREGGGIAPAVEHVDIRSTDPRGGKAHEHLAPARFVDLDLLEPGRFSGLTDDYSSSLHIPPAPAYLSTGTPATWSPIK